VRRLWGYARKTASCGVGGHEGIVPQFLYLSHKWSSSRQVRVRHFGSESSAMVIKTSAWDVLGLQRWGRS
jgi:hypothetical protein